MSKINLNSIANLQNENTVIVKINNNSITLEDAIENTLSRNGSSPNSMEATLDMDSNPIINLPAATTPDMPIRRQEFDEAILGTAVLPTITGTSGEIDVDLVGNNYNISISSLLVPSFWDIRDLEVTTPATIATNVATFNATSITFYNPNTQVAIYYAPGTVTANKTCSIATFGAGGRDAAATYTIGDQVWFYYIAGPTSNFNTLVSKTSPLGTNALADLGPVLPTGYTTYCPAFPFVIGDISDLTHDSLQTVEGSAIINTFTGSTSTFFMSTLGEATGPIPVGSKIFGTDIPEDTFVTEVNSHSGTGGLYTLSKNVGTIGAEAMFYWARFPVNFLVRNKKVWFKGAITDDVSEQVPFSPSDYYPWDYSRWVPSGAKTLDVMLDPEIRTTDADGLTQSAFIVAWGDANDAILSTYAYTDSDFATAQNVGLEFPVSSARTLPMIYLQGAGVTLSTAAVNFLRGYTF